VETPSQKARPEHLSSGKEKGAKPAQKRGNFSEISFRAILGRKIRRISPDEGTKYFLLLERGGRERKKPPSILPRRVVSTKKDEGLIGKGASPLKKGDQRNVSLGKGRGGGEKLKVLEEREEEKGGQREWEKKKKSSHYFPSLYQGNRKNIGKTGEKFWPTPSSGGGGTGRTF